jgi:ankyrin repeat protein
VICPLLQHGWTPLIAAAAKGRVESVRLLLASGANAQILDKYGKSALDYASDHCFSDVMSILSQAIREQRAMVRRLCFLGLSLFSVSFGMQRYVFA